MATDVPKDKKGPDSLFGPNVGVISSGPAWTTLTEKKVLKDELTMDIVKGWIDKSKQPTQPTTTLQALVNLKRPTIRLSPLSADDTDDDKHAQQHGLEFEFDCDAPKCGIYVHVLLPSTHPDAHSTSADATSPADDSTTPPKLSKLLVFESVVDGGFGNVLKLEEGAVLELGRFENTGKPTTTTTPAEDPTANVVAATVNGITTTTTPNNSTTTTNTRNPRRRLTHFFSSRRHHNPNVSVSGPALAVVDASANPSSAGTNTDEQAKDSKNKDKDKDNSNGIKVTIRLAALDEQGTELASPNEQVTYLCVERFGAKPVKSSTPPVGESATAGTTQEAAAATATATEGGDNKVEEEEEEDTRPWVVKVVKREATIGPHTFHLHEIYGLTSSSPSTHTHAPTAPLPSTHTYPPTTTTNPGQPLAHTPDANAAEDPDAPSECLLCLSSPREVVLLPCRHLVACKDCALNMVEFGAGGNITQGTEDAAAPAATTGTTGAATGTGTTGTTGGTGTGETATATGTGTGTGAETTTTIQNPRRKRKAKGWFCPVCRQPYTSLLRITTNPPPLPVGKGGETDGEAEGHEEDGDADGDGDVEGDITEAHMQQHPLANSSVNVNANASSGGLPLPVTTNVQGAGAAGVPVSVSVSGGGTGSSVDVNANSGSTGVNTGASSGVNGANNTSGGGEGGASTSGGGLFTRPGFLRGLTGKSKNGNGNGGTGERDLESQL